MEIDCSERDGWEDPLVAEVREVRRLLFEEAGNDIEELARMIGSGASSGDSVSGRTGSVAPNGTGQLSRT